MKLADNTPERTSGMSGLLARRLVEWMYVFSLHGCRVVCSWVPAVLVQVVYHTSASACQGALSARRFGAVHVSHRCHQEPCLDRSMEDADGRLASFGKRHLASVARKATLLAACPARPYNTLYAAHTRSSSPTHRDASRRIEPGVADVGRLTRLLLPHVSCQMAPTGCAILRVLHALSPM